MFFSPPALTKTARPQGLRLFGSGFACLGLATMAAAQSGSVAFTVESFQAISEATTASEYPFFESLYVTPFTQSSAAGPVDMLILQRFDRVFESNLDDAEDDAASYTMIAEYDATGSGVMRESGLIAFKVKTEPLANAQGDNIIGFVRPASRQAPSTLAAGATLNSGYLTGLSGEVFWDFKAESRRGYLVGTGADYSPATTHESYLTFTATSNRAGFTGLNLPVAGSDSLSWNISTPLIRGLRDRTTNNQALYYGIINRSDFLNSEVLGLENDDPADDLVSADSGKPWEFNNRAYILRLQNIADTDGDRVPDFIDLTETIVQMPVIADWAGPNNWFYAGMTDDWIYSTRSTDWDYTGKFGWTWPHQPSPRTNYWFYVNSANMGWMWTSHESFPILYRHADGAYLQWMSTQDRTSSYYNFSNRTVETTSF
jgi:hypothetical protein